MIEWREIPTYMVGAALGNICEAEIESKLDQLEHGDIPPYEVLRDAYIQASNTRLWVCWCIIRAS